MDSYQKYTEAYVRLKELVMEKDPEPYLTDALIQRFEFCFELAWKSLKQILFYAEGVDARSPKAALREAYALKWIDDEQLWLDMLEDRNNTSHTYNQKLAVEIAERVKQKYCMELGNLLGVLQGKQREAKK